MGIRERSESRDGYAVRVLAVHTSEGFDKPVVDDAAALRDASWWVGSSHAIADNDPGSLLTPAEGCVPYDLASWTLRSGNRWSENIELIAQAGWTRAQWLERPKLLDNCARWLADRSKARGIPLVKLTPQQYRAGASGVIGHHDHTIGYSDGTHWDPGPNYPWDVVIDKARAYAGGGTDQEDDMSPAESQMLKDIKAEVMAARRQDYVVLSGQVARILAALQQGPGADIDEAALAAALAPSVIAALGEAKGITGADVEAALRRVLADAAQA